MKKLGAVIALLIVFVLILFGPSLIKKTEGFTNKVNEVLDTPLVRQPYTPEVAEAGVGNIQPSPQQPGALPSAPFEGRAGGVPLPYKDPGQQPAKYIRLLGVMYDLQAFFGFQAGLLKDTCDPVVVMPLQRAKADLQSIQNVQQVLERNPGVPSRITNGELNEVVANLRYLQKYIYDLDASKSGVSTHEGFEDINVADISPRATVDQLRDFDAKVVAESARLNSSGATDPVIQARINSLDRIHADMTEILQQVADGLLQPEDIPIFQSDIEKALPILGSPTSPLPQLVQQAGLPSAIQNAFPAGLSPKDSAAVQALTKTANSYLQDLTQGLSWDLGVAGIAGLGLHYDSPRAAQIGGSNKKIGSTQTYDLLSNLINSKQSKNGVTTVAEFKAVDPQQPQEILEGLPGTSVRPVLQEPNPGGFDWKTRSRQVCEQIRMRGLDPTEFGCLPSGTEVSTEFSWKGHMKMLCNRLLSTTDPGLPETCGCPPQDWAGWRTA